MKKNSALSIFNGNLFNSLDNYCFQTFFRISKVLNRRPTQEFFKNVETSPLSVKGYKLWPVLGTHSHIIEQWWLFSMPHLLWHCDTSHTFIIVISEDLWHSPIAGRLAVDLSQLVLTRITSVPTGDLTQISRIRGGRSTTTPPRRSVKMIHTFFYPNIST